MTLAADQLERRGTPTDWFIPSPETPISLEMPKIGERTLYVGCVHGGDEAFFSQLDALAQGDDDILPDVLVLGGDLAGATNQRTIRQKQLFYNHLMNAVNPILKDQTDISPTDLLASQVTQPDGTTHSVREGVLGLLAFAVNEMAQMHLDGDSLQTATTQLAWWQMASHPYENMPESNVTGVDSLLYNYIHWIRNVPSEGKYGLNSGTWVGTLPGEMRQQYLNQYRQSAEMLGERLLALKNRGVKILWVEGNEDMQVSLEAISHGLPEVFDTQKYLIVRGIDCATSIQVDSSGSVCHILIPFRTLRTDDFLQEEHILSLQRQVGQAIAEGKKIVMVPHLQLDWGRHYVGQRATGEPAEMAERLRQLIFLLIPDEIVYPHQHNEMPGAPDLNAKYIVKPYGGVVTYLPLMAIGISDRKPAAQNETPKVRFNPFRDTIRRIQ